MSRPSTGYIEKVAHSILARPEFHPPGPNLIDRTVSDVGRWLSHIFSHLPGVSGGGISTVLASVVVAAVLSVAVLLVVHAVRHRMPTRTYSDVDAAAKPVATEEWLERGKQAEQAGEWREALRCRYRASVASLASRGLVVEIPGRTAGEYRMQVVRSVPDAYPDFAALTDGFERAWYAGVPVGPDEGRRSAYLYDAVNGAARSTAGGVGAAPGGVDGAPGGVGAAPGGVDGAPGGVGAAPGGAGAAPRPLVPSNLAEPAP